MRSTITIHLRRFRVALRDRETKEEITLFLTLDKTQLQAAQVVGQSSRELLERIAGRNGFDLLDIIGKPDRLSLTIPLDELWRRGCEEQEAQAKWAYLYGTGEGEAMALDDR